MKIILAYPVRLSKGVSALLQAKFFPPEFMEDGTVLDISLAALFPICSDTNRFCVQRPFCVGFCRSGIYHLSRHPSICDNV